MSFSGNPGTGKTTVALRMADLLHRLGYVRKGHLVTVTRDDLVGQYIGHTAPKTKEVLKKAMGGVLFIDEAYYLYRPENERDYGQEAIEILLQVMENNRDDLVVILAGYGDRMDALLRGQPGLPLAHRPPHRLSRLQRRRAPPRSPSRCSPRQNYTLTDAAGAALAEYIAHRRGQPHFANARSIRNALDRARLRQANRLFQTASGPLDAAAPQRDRRARHPRQPRLQPAASTPTGGPNHDASTAPRRSPRRSSPPTSPTSAPSAAPSRRRAPTGSTST